MILGRAARQTGRVGVYVSEHLSFACFGKASRGKAKVKTGIGKSDLPGLQGGPRKRDLVRPSARASALSRLGGNIRVPP